MKPYRGFADLVRRRRKELKLTLESVADAMQWSIPYVSEIERGLKQPPSREAVTRLASVLELDSAALAREAALSRRSVEIDLEGTGKASRRLAVMLARRINQGLSEDEAEKLLQQLIDEGDDFDVI